MGLFGVMSIIDNFLLLLLEAAGSQLIEYSIARIL